MICTHSCFPVIIQGELKALTRGNSNSFRWLKAKDRAVFFFAKFKSQRRQLYSYPCWVLFWYWFSVNRDRIHVKSFMTCTVSNTHRLCFHQLTVSNWSQTIPKRSKHTLLLLMSEEKMSAAPSEKKCESCQTEAISGVSCFFFGSSFTLRSILHNLLDHEFRYKPTKNPLLQKLVWFHLSVKMV